LFNWFDWLAVSFGTLVVAYGIVESTNKLKLRDHFVNFGSGTSSIYLFIVAYGIAKDPEIFKAVATSNSVLLAGSLVFAGLFNLQIVAESIKKA
jgi:uncharacterized transporter YbjL